MLILTRKIQESIIIGADIKVFILGIHMYQVKIGISAPCDISICRTEIYPRYHAEQIKQGHDKSGLITVNSKSE